MFTLGILTISDKGSAGLREDISGRVTREIIEAAGGFRVVKYEIVPDEKDIIARKLVQWSDEAVDVILTNGGTGLAERDVTPEATASVIEKEVPGIPEAVRISTMQKTPMAMISRAKAGIRKKTLIINMPGNPRAVREYLEVLVPVLPHAVEMLKGIVTEHGK